MDEVEETAGAAPGEVEPGRRGARVLIVDDEAPFRRVLERNLGRAGLHVEGVGDAEAALARLAEARFDVVVADIRLPGITGLELTRRVRQGGEGPEVIVMTGQASIPSAIEAMRFGAYDYVQKPLQMSELALLIEKAAFRHHLAAENVRLKGELARRAPPSSIVGQSAAIREVQALIDRYAAADAPVLVLGESGTGKELVARSIHLRGPRARGPFVPINCGALKESILENELFGHVRGAFTGADQDRAGLFEAADEGVLFIDEVCEMGLGVQKTFLRVLEDGRVRRVGDVRERPVSVRIVAATNKPIEVEVAEGRFRADLYYRLNVLRLELPPLRARVDDLPALCQHYLDLYERRTGIAKALSPDARAALARHRWPGNVRELFNVLERALIVDVDDVIGPDDMPGLEGASTTPEARVAAPGAGEEAGLTLDAIERLHIERALRAVGGNRTHAARELGISLRSLYRKLQKYGLG